MWLRIQYYLHLQNSKQQQTLSSQHFIYKLNVFGSLTWPSSENIDEPKTFSFDVNV